jgi:hypothetical protein
MQGRGNDYRAVITRYQTYYKTNWSSLQSDEGTFYTQSYVHIVTTALVSLFTMLSNPYSSIAWTILALGSSSTDGRKIYKRDCSFTWPATSGDTCATMSSDWRLDEATFKAMNPGVDCSNLVPDQEYCVEWDGTLPIPPAETSTPAPTSLVPSSTTLVTVTSSSTAPGGPVIPSPIQSGVASNCELQQRSGPVIPS